VDTTKTITHISLCAGYGGIDIGLSQAIPNLRTIAFSEIEAFAAANLVSKMESGLLDCAPIWTNLKTLPWDGFLGKVDIISGGFPCQPFSCAGKRDGDEDPRHLFPYILDGIRRCRPSVVFLENVEGILSAKLSGDNWRDPAGTPVLLHVIRELERLGYKATAGIFSASEVGAPHQRKRVFIMAHTRSICAEGANQDRVNANRICELSRGSEIWGETIGCSNLWPSRPSQPQYEWEPPRVVEQEGRVSETEGNQPTPSIEQSINPCGEVTGQTQPSMGGDPNGPSCGVGHAELRESDHAAGGFYSEARYRELDDTRLLGSEGNEQQATTVKQSSELDDTRGAEQHRIPSQQWQEDPASWKSGVGDLYVTCENRTDELRLLGNGVVPATAELAFRTLWAELNQTN